MTSTNQVQDAERHHAKIQARDSLIDQAERDVYEQFMAAALSGDANAVCKWAPMVRDFGHPPGPGGERRMRCQTFSEVLAESTDTPRSVQLVEVHQLLLNAALGADVKEQALELLKRAGGYFAWMHGKNLEETT